MRTTTDDINARVTDNGGHEAAGHRIADSAGESRVCIRCGTLHYARRVSPPDWRDGRLRQADTMEWHVTLCPPCQMASAGHCAGVVFMRAAL